MKMNPTLKKTILNVIESVLTFLLAVIIITGVKSCVAGSKIPENFKEAKKFLKKQDFTVKYVDDEDKIEEIFDFFDIDPHGVNKLLVAVDDDNSSDVFLIIDCDSVALAEIMLEDLTNYIYTDNYFYYNKYDVKIDYQTVYFGNKQLISSLTD